ncbi:carbohydrate kinase family protein [Janthinobacterium agaricidamnosum]|uniref:PfkB carbohydrate kinase family protein n=1 Tax=Janthinobacterium agaricidamnosum NBRC 102515 = DSM 9628 TaxID=1349767 RepID=W0V4E0_9BURK|nr:carbohydrate kinase family protein [Janthinobacterium agaricidamnosum]CDG82435.1 pfkB carbohydrate kinase family protein [Janthinobacterium agaricidamnosum NBRC 102515 = DSM 9628]
MGSIDGWPQIGTEVIMSRSELRAGGSGANAALAMRHLGQPAHLISAVGNDDFGVWLRTQFHELRTDLQVCPVPSTVSVGIMHGIGERNFFTTQGHLEHLSSAYALEQLPPADCPGAIVLFTGVFLLPALRRDYPQLMRSVASLGYQVALDTGWPSDNWNTANRAEFAAWLPLCDHLLINELEALSITDNTDLDSAIAVLSAGLKPGATLVVKTGPRGATGVQNASRVDHASENAAIFDTIGAGDSFNAGYLAARLQGASLAQALSTGCRAAVAILTRFPRHTIVPGEFASVLSHS